MSDLAAGGIGDELQALVPLRRCPRELRRGKISGGQFVRVGLG